MNILIIGKYPPIQGGVSRNTYDTAHTLAQNGNNVFVITNSEEVEWGYRQRLFGNDLERLSSTYNDGFVKLLSTEPFPSNMTMIPYSPAYESKLFGLCVKLLREEEIDMIYSYYYQPYGLIASIVSKLFDIPLVLNNAGSDLGSLSYHNNLNEAYKWMISNCTSYAYPKNKQFRNIEVEERLKELGLDEKKRTSGLRHKKISFPKNPSKLDIKELFKETLDDWVKESPLNSDLMEIIKIINKKKIRDDVPTIGIYGKVGNTKSNFQLVEALKKLANEGYEFNFITIATGKNKVLTKYYTKIVENKKLGDKSWILPPIAPWRIPSFIKLLDIGCFLEHNFTIKFHTPQVAREIASVGSFLLYSKEIADKEMNKDLKTIENSKIVADPHDIDQLTLAIKELLDGRFANLNSTKKALNNNK